MRLHMSDKMKKDKYGIKVRKWCHEHEELVESALAGNDDIDPGRILILHEKRLSWLMHERLVHVVVLLITVTATMFSLGIVLLAPDLFPYTFVLFAILFILLVFYIRHYFFLENTVQHWYVLYDSILARIG